MSSSQLLELPATRGRLHALAAAGVLDAEQLDAVMVMTPVSSSLTDGLK